MEINLENINAYKTILLDPHKHGFEFDAITDCFAKSEVVVAKHLLADAYLKYMDKPLPKVFLYIIMNEVFGQCDGKDTDGNLGYHLKFTK